MHTTQHTTQEDTPQPQVHEHSMDANERDKIDDRSFKRFPYTTQFQTLLTIIEYTTHPHSHPRGYKSPVNLTETNLSQYPSSTGSIIREG